MSKYSELVAKAIEELKNNDDLFVACVNELDSWNGFADGFRAYDMSELDDLFGSMKVSEFLDILADSFNHRDNYFYDSIYGIDSCDYIEELYRDNVDDGELLDNLIENYYDIDIAWIDSDFDELLNEIVDIIAATEE